MVVLRRRNSMHEDAVDSGFPYHLIAGTATHGFTITTTEEGHITLSNASRQTTGKFLHFRDVAQYFTTQAAESDINNLPKWFTLKAGQEVTLSAQSLPSAVQVRLYVANSVTVYKSLTNSSPSVTFTVDEDVDIGSVGARTSAAINAGTTSEFDIALYVDGVRYF